MKINIKRLVPQQLSRRMASTFVLAALGVGSAMAGSVTFGQYFQLGGAQQQWSISTSGGTTTVHADGSVSLNLSGVAGLPFAGPENAMFTLDATSNTAGNCSTTCIANDTFSQQGYSGTFSFIDNGGGFAQGTNLLSGTFAVTGDPTNTGAQFSSSLGSSGGSFTASAAPGNLSQLVFTSAYLDFTGQTQETSSFSLSSLIPNFAVGAVTVTGTSSTAYPANGPFHAAGSGTFSSNPGPDSIVPEPASMGLIGGGLLALGFVFRKRRLEVAGR